MAAGGIESSSQLNPPALDESKRAPVVSFRWGREGVDADVDVVVPLAE